MRDIERLKIYLASAKTGEEENDKKYDIIVEQKKN